MDIYLSLIPEYGATEFGPYRCDEILLGSNQQICHIAIPVNFGTLPVHAKIMVGKMNQVFLTPVEQNAAVFLFRPGSAPQFLLQATEIQSGDQFSIVSENGPRFIVGLRPSPKGMQKQRPPIPASTRANKSTAGTQMKSFLNRSQYRQEANFFQWFLALFGFGKSQK